MKGSLGEFTASIDRWVGQLDKHLDELVQNVAFEIAENVIVGGRYSPGTPIDTGWARASWWVSVGDPGTPHQNSVNIEGKQVQPDPASVAPAATAKAGDTVWLLSNTEYMPVLEYGWSQQAPQGMIRITLANGQAIVDEVAMKMGAKP